MTAKGLPFSVTTTRSVCDISKNAGAFLANSWMVILFIGGSPPFASGVVCGGQPARELHSVLDSHHKKRHTLLRAIPKEAAQTQNRPPQTRASCASLSAYRVDAQVASRWRS